MVKNEKIGNHFNDSPIDEKNEWSILEEMNGAEKDEQNRLLDEQSNNGDEVMTEEQRLKKLEKLAEKVKDAYYDAAELKGGKGKMDNGEKMRGDGGVDDGSTKAEGGGARDLRGDNSGNKRTGVSNPIGRFMEKVMQKRQENISAKLSSKHYGDKGCAQDMRKFEKLVRDKKLDLHNTVVADNYLKMEIQSKTSLMATDMDKMIEGGADRNKVVKAAIDQFVAWQNRSNDMDFRKVVRENGADVRISTLATILDKYGDEENYEQLKQRVDVSEIGKKYLDDVFGAIDEDGIFDDRLMADGSLVFPESFHEEDEKGRRMSYIDERNVLPEVRRTIGVLQKLGFQAFEEEKDLDSIMGRGRSSSKNIGAQKIAQVLGLVDGEVVDCMYIHKYNMLMSGRYFSDLSIDSSLVPSGEINLVNILYKNHKLGNDDGLNVLMSEVVGRWKYHGSLALCLMDTTNQNNKKEYRREFLEYLLEDQEGLRGTDKRIIGCYKRMPENTESFMSEHEDKKSMKDYFVEKLMDANQHYARDKIYRYDTIDTYYNEDGSFSNEAYQEALFDVGLFDEIAMYDEECRSHYSEKMLKFFDESKYNSLREKYERLLTEPELINELTPRIRGYLETVRQTDYSYNIGSIMQELDFSKMFDEEGLPTKELVVRLFEEPSSRIDLAKMRNVEALLTKEQERYLEIYVKSGFSNQFLTRYTDEIINDVFSDKYFDEDGSCKPEFWQRMYHDHLFDTIIGFGEEERQKMGLSEEQSRAIETYESLSDEERAIYFKLTKNNGNELLTDEQRRYLKLYKDSGFSEVFLTGYTDEIINDVFSDKYFNKDGSCKPEFWQRMYHVHLFDTIIGYDEEERRKMGLSEEQLKTIKIYESLSDEERGLYFEFVSNNGEDSDEDHELDISTVMRILSEIKRSNAAEMANNAKEFARYIFNSNFNGDEKDALKTLSKMEDIFVHNNLPYFSKVFRCFQMMRDAYQISGAMGRASLGNAPESGAYITKDAILYNDLFKAALGSNNRDLKEYLRNIKKGDSLAIGIMNGELSMDDLSPEDADVLRRYANHLRAMHENLQKTKEENGDSEGDDNIPIEDKLRYYYRAFQPTSRYTVPDRIVRSFGYSLGFRSFNQMDEYVNNVVQVADRRNREYAKKNEFSLRRGDLVKTIDARYFEKILQNGSVCKEFLNGEGRSDVTPLDTDLTVIEDEVSGSISEGVNWKNRHASFGSDNLMIVMKGDEYTNRNRFQAEGVDNQYDPNRYELWNNGGSNYGIRVGFPSSEIDFMVYDSFGVDLAGDGLNRVKFDIARNGFYIPVVDKDSGELVFSPEEYDRMRESMGGLDYYEAGDYHFAKDMTVNNYVTNDGQEINGTNAILEQMAEDEGEVERKSGAVEDVIRETMNGLGLGYKAYVDGDLTEGSVENVGTGSTSRGTNVPGDGDFDYMMKLDKRIIDDEAKMNDLRNALLEAFKDCKEANIYNGNLRLKGVRVPGLEEDVDVDVTFEQKTNKVQYSTDEALRRRLMKIREQSPEEARQVIANIIFAKEFFKAHGAYKPSRSDASQGGMGGVGVENWILQHGGSFVEAARAFMEVANQSSSFDKFQSRYAVFDYGENHVVRSGTVHDNFINNMSSNGYEKIKAALGDFLERYA